VLAQLLIMTITALFSDEEVKKRCQKRARKERRKAAASDKGDNESAVIETEGQPLTPTIAEQFRRLKVIKAGGKVRSLDVNVRLSSGKSVQDQDDLVALFTVLLAGNAIERHAVPLSNAAESNLLERHEQPGHRTDVRTVAFSSDNTAILSGSSESVKLWARSSATVLRTVPSGYALSSLFVPGDRQVVIGTKSGALQLVDVAAAEVLEDIKEAHSREVKCVLLCLLFYPLNCSFTLI